MENKILSQILDSLNELKLGQQEIKADVSTLKNDVSSLKTDVSTLKNDVSSLKADVSSLKTDVATIKMQLSDLETKNALNHMDIREQLDLIKKDLSFIEVVSGKNMTEIALLKAVK